MKLISSYYYLLASIYGFRQKDTVLVLEGLHLSGKTLLSVQLAKDLYIPTYSTWRGMGGRKSSIQRATGTVLGVEDWMDLGPAYFYVLDYIAQTTNKRSQNACVFDRGHLGMAYYSPENYHHETELKIRQIVDLKYIFVQPMLDDRTIGVPDELITQDSRCVSNAVYAKEVLKYRKLFERLAPEDSIIYENRFDRPLVYEDPKPLDLDAFSGLPLTDQEKNVRH